MNGLFDCPFVTGGVVGLCDRRHQCCKIRLRVFAATRDALVAATGMENNIISSMSKQLCVSTSLRIPTLSSD